MISLVDINLRQYHNMRVTVAGDLAVLVDVAATALAVGPQQIMQSFRVCLVPGKISYSLAWLG